MMNSGGIFRIQNVRKQKRRKQISIAFPKAEISKNIFITMRKGLLHSDSTKLFTHKKSTARNFHTIFPQFPTRILYKLVKVNVPNFKFVKSLNRELLVYKKMKWIIYLLNNIRFREYFKRFSFPIRSCYLFFYVLNFCKVESFSDEVSKNFNAFFHK